MNQIKTAKHSFSFIIIVAAVVIASVPKTITPQGVIGVLKK